MAWATGQPADGSKIRNFPQLTRDNFAAIEDGDTSLEYTFVNLSEQGSPPSDLANDIRVYGAAGTTYTSLFAHNENGDDIQITDDAFLGANTQSLALQDLSFDISNANKTLDANFIPHAYGHFSSGGTLTAAKSANIASVALSDTSLYTITTEAIFANANALCIATPYGTDKTLAAVVTTITESGGALTIKIRIRNQDNSSNASACQFMVLGGM
jgi:hypothetical protein